MTNKRWDGAGMVDLTIKKRWDGASWVDLTVSKRWDGATWVDFFAGPGGGLSATANDGTIFGSELRIGAGQPSVLAVGSDNPSQVIVTAIGGTGPYTYSWSHVGGDSAVQVVNPSSGTTGFIANVGKNQNKQADKRCTVTDSLGATAFVDVHVSLTYIFEF